MERSENNISLKLLFPLILFISTVGIIATDIYLPSFPMIKTEFAVSNNVVQWSFSLYLFTYSLSQLFYGPASEKYGRRKIALFGCVFSLVATAVCVVAPNVLVLILGRMLQGIAFGSGPVLSRAIVRDVFKGNVLAQIASFLSVATAFMMAVAPILGGYIQHYLGWRFNFGFILLYTFVGTIILWFLLPETLIKPDHSITQIKKSMEQFFILLRSPIFMAYALLSGLSFAGLTVYLSASPFLFQQVLAFTPVEYGWLALVIAAGLALGGLINSLFVKKVGRDRMLVYAVLVLVLGGVSMLLLSIRFLNAFVIMIPMFIYMCGTGISLGNAYAGAFHYFPKIAGFAAALFGTLQILMSAIGTSIMAVIHERNQIPLGIFLIIIGICCFFLQWLGHHFSKKMHIEQ